MKKCVRCESEKSLEMFYKNKTRPDGFQYECKDCENSYRQSKRGRAYQAKYKKSPEWKISKAKGSVKYNSNNPYRHKAHQVIRDATKRGKLTRPDNCSDCSSACRPEAHHDDYNHPLQVRWLCRPCHMAWHKVNKAIEHINKENINV